MTVVSRFFFGSHIWFIQGLFLCFGFLNTVFAAASMMKVETKVLSIELEPYSSEVLVGLKQSEKSFRVLNRDLAMDCLTRSLKNDSVVNLEIDPLTGRIIQCNSTLQASKSEGQEYK